MGVDGAAFICGLNVPEEDKYSYNHSKKVHSTSRAAFDKQIIPSSRIIMFCYWCIYDSMYSQETTLQKLYKCELSQHTYISYIWDSRYCSSY